jgi:uncharacterized protein YkwD
MRWLGAIALLASFVVLGAAGPGEQVAGEPEVPPALKGILAAHNRLRANHCAPTLRWSDALAAVAQRWADHLAKAGCDLEHSGGKYGENLAAATPGALASEDVVGMWYAERDKYRWDRPGFSPTTGHFTQVIWRGSARVGCGVAACPAMQVWVCNYDPPGNVQGQYTKNVLRDTCARR